MDLEAGEEDYNSMTREDLVDKIRKLSCHVKQLRNIVRRDTADSADHPNGIRSFKKARRDRAFDFSKHPKRHVALKVAYLGWDYQGLAVQEDTDNTIETHLFRALTKSKLIEDRSTSNYHRCGRTDKGVSAFCQVISIDLRCKCNDGLGVISQMEDNVQNSKHISDLALEIDYCKILNAILPKEIRVLAWAPVRPDFSARFDCKERVYRYLIPAGDANLSAMQQAGAYLIGEHNFQNFCKVDTSGEKTTIRRIICFKMSKCSPMERVESSDNKYCIYELEIRGQAFLWHQIRCIVAVLILVGKGLEEPEIVRDMLDLEKMPKKPQYSMAMDYPLVLFDTYHGNEIKEWISNPDNIYHVLTDLQTLWSQHALKAQMVLGMLKSLENCSAGVDATAERSDSSSKPVPHRFIPPRSSPTEIPTRQLDCLVMGTKTKIYKPLAQRPVCARIQNQSSGKLDNSMESNDAPTSSP